jgi:hypothetical protein
MQYPEHHKTIVEELMNGRFILSRDVHFETLRKEEEFYSAFFKISFDYDLLLTQEYARITSKESNENLSRDISIFFAILCYELDKEGKNFLDSLAYEEFSLEEIDLLFDNSSFIDLIKANNQIKDSEARRKLLNAMNRKNIIDFDHSYKFSFTPAYKVFIEFARELAQKSEGEEREEQEGEIYE